MDKKKVWTLETLEEGYRHGFDFEISNGSEKVVAVTNCDRCGGTAEADVTYCNEYGGVNFPIYCDTCMETLIKELM